MAGTAAKASSCPARRTPRALYKKILSSLLQDPAYEIAASAHLPQ